MVFQIRNGANTFLETVDGEINFYSEDPDRGFEALGYRMKTGVDDTSIDALSNTLKKLCKRFGATRINLRVEFERPHITERYMEHARDQRAQAAEKHAKHGPQAELAARVTTQPAQSDSIVERKKRSRGGGRGRGGASHSRNEAPVQGNASEHAAPAADYRTDMARETCAQCGKAGHPAIDCVEGKAKCGTIRACPLCNTKEHPLDRCGVIAATQNTDYVRLVEELAHFLVVARTNAPQICSRDWTFYDVLQRAVAAGVKGENEILGYPWSRSFAQKILAARSNDPILGGKVHPRDFVHGRHLTADLPEDPLFAGKTIREILLMRNSGLLEHDRFGPAAPFLTGGRATASLAGPNTGAVLTEKEADEVLQRLSGVDPPSGAVLTDKEADDLLQRHAGVDPFDIEDHDMGR